jgi:hypothetical protein
VWQNPATNMTPYRLELEISVHNLEPPLGSIHFDMSTAQPDSYIPNGFDSRLRVTAEGQDRWVIPDVEHYLLSTAINEIVFDALLIRQYVHKVIRDGVNPPDATQPPRHYTIEGFSLEPAATFLAQTMYPTEPQNWNWVEHARVAP